MACRSFHHFNKATSDTLKEEEAAETAPLLSEPICHPELEMSSDQGLHKPSDSDNGKSHALDLNGDSPKQPLAQTDDFLSLSLYEKKSYLVNRELDKLGFGRYQTCIFLLCGFGYFLDLMWAQLYGLILGAIAQEMNVPAGTQPNLYSAMNAGLTVGAFFWGCSADIIGRKWAFNLTCLVTCVFGTLSAAPPTNFNAICGIVALAGFGLGGNIPLDATITLEFLPQNKRWVLPLLSMFQPIGVTVCTVLAFAFIPNFSCAPDLESCLVAAAPCCGRSNNMGWRYLTITIGGLTLFIFILRFFVFNFRESPKYLLSRGKDQEAIDVVHSIYKFNKHPTGSTLSMKSFRALVEETSTLSDPTRPMLGGEPKTGIMETTKVVARRGIRRLAHLKGLFTDRKMVITAILLWIAYISDFWAFNLAGGFLPIILRRNGNAVNQSLQTLYTQYIIIYTPGILGAIFGALAIQIPRVGRKWAMVFSAALMSISMFLYTQAKTIPANVGLNALEYISQTMYNAILYAYTPEVFPAPYRGSASAIASTLGRISGIVAPLAAAPFFAAESNGVLYLGAGGALLSMCAVALLPVETRGRESF